MEMTTDQIVTRVNSLMENGFEIPAEKLLPNAHLFNDLGLDSLDTIDMVVHLEEGLKIKVDSERLMNVRTLKDVYELVADLSRGKKT